MRSTKRGQKMKQENKQTANQPKKEMKNKKETNKKEIVFVTTNSHKVKEAQDLLKDYTITQIDLQLPELQAPQDDIVLAKASTACLELNKAVVVDDTGFYINALGGMPGEYAAHFIKALGTEKIGRIASIFDDKSVIFKTCVAYAEPGKKPLVFVGEVAGTILDAPRGDNHGFGYDPLFVPDGHTKTYAEMTTEEKNKISQRQQAFLKLAAYLEAHQ